MIGLGRGEHGNVQRTLQLGQHRVEVVVRADHHQGVGTPVRGREDHPEPVDQGACPGDRVVDRGLYRAPRGIDHVRIRRVTLDDAHRGGLVTDDVGDPPGQCLGRLRQPHRDDVVEARVCERLEQNRRLAVGVGGPGHPDDPQPVTLVGGRRLGPNHCRGRLLTAVGLHREGLMVDGHAVGVMAFDQNQTDGGGCHRHAEHRVHMHPLGAVATQEQLSAEASERTGKTVAVVHFVPVTLPVPVAPGTPRTVRMAGTGRTRNVLCRKTPRTQPGIGLPAGPRNSCPRDRGEEAGNRPRVRPVAWTATAGVPVPPRQGVRAHRRAPMANQLPLLCQPADRTCAPRISRSSSGSTLPPDSTITVAPAEVPPLR